MAAVLRPGVKLPHCSGFSRGGARLRLTGFSGCRPRARVLRDVRDILGLGVEPRSLQLQVDLEPLDHQASPKLVLFIDSFFPLRFFYPLLKRRL